MDLGYGICALTLLQRFIILKFWVYGFVLVVLNLKSVGTSSDENPICLIDW